MSSISEIIGHRIKAIRTERGWTGDDLARQAVREGLTSWNTVVVSRLESGERGVSAEELLLLPAILRVSLADLLTADGHRIDLAPETSIGPEAVKPLLAGDSAHVRDALVDSPHWREQMQKPHSKRFPLFGATRDARGEAERKAARRLGASPLTVASAALELWGHSLTVERDIRADRQAPPRADLRTRQAIRGRVTRGLLEEIRAHIEKVGETRGWD